ncbi:MAG: hypothetical protein Q7R34_16295, partial [Dehalococcoidia bacterium]|nr:hypothetical protein [Dehalococcoidia bacterium]
MFYPVSAYEGKKGLKVEFGIAVFTPSESRRLIARAVANMPEVKNALLNNILIIARGVTNAFVAEEILGIKIDDKSRYTLGCITGGELTANTGEDRMKPFVLVKGQKSDISPREALKDFDGQSVYIKGANAVDMQGNAGILMSNPDGGSIGEALPPLLARGSRLIVPVGLEKLVPSVIEATPRCGIFHFKYSTGLPVSMTPLVSALVVTEIQALKILCGLSAYHVASGGIGGSEGSVVLSVEGSPQELEVGFSLIKSIKGEPAIAGPAKTTARASSFDYNTSAIWSALH